MDYILSEKNKEFLWNILYEKNIFNGIPNNNLDKVKSLFESTITNVSENTKNKELIETNKVLFERIGELTEKNRQLQEAMSKVNTGSVVGAMVNSSRH